MREGEPSTEVVGNHPAARVIASLRRSAAIVVSCHPLAAATLPTMSSAGFSYRFLPFSLLSLSLSLLLSLSRSHSLRSSLRLVRFGLLATTAPRTPSLLLLSLRPSLFRSDDGSGSSSSLEPRASWLPFIYRYTEYGYPLSFLPLAASPRHPASHRLRHPTLPAPSPSHPSAVLPRHAVAFATVEAEFNYFISPYTDQRRHRRRRRCRCRRRRYRRCQPRAESDVSRRRLLAPSFTPRAVPSHASAA